MCKTGQFCSRLLLNKSFQVTIVIITFSYCLFFTIICPIALASAILDEDIAKTIRSSVGLARGLIGLILHGFLLKAICGNERPRWYVLAAICYTSYEIFVGFADLAAAFVWTPEKPTNKWTVVITRIIVAIVAVFNLLGGATFLYVLTKAGTGRTTAESELLIESASVLEIPENHVIRPGEVRGNIDDQVPSVNMAPPPYNEVLAEDQETM
ncbi:hypothetical protein L596_009795 [Steinernema carpocapsae]|uniref:Uncharacterized protein n=1 Tax=Steinernema carpocapsae TaxID=34508 RepID=A0A4U5PGL7_STECR|nr:hypothetical protein L596_009795 [Steinernema carpocapsae]